MGSPLFFCLDLCAAFGTIVHTSLFNRLIYSFGIMGFSHNWLKSYLSNRSFSVTSGPSSSFILPSSCGVPQGSVLGPILFTIFVSPIALIVSSPGVNLQQYADDTQLFVFLSTSSLFRSLCSLQQCVSSLHSWFIHNGIVLNPTKTEAIYFGTSRRLQSLSYLTSIEVAGTSVSLVDTVKLLGVTFDKHLNFDKHISNVCSSSYFHIRPFLTQKLPILWPGLSWFQIRLCQFHSYWHFFSHYPSSSARSKLLGSSCYSLNYQHHLSSKFTSLASNSATNQF